MRGNGKTKVKKMIKRSVFWGILFVLLGMKFCVNEAKVSAKYVSNAAWDVEQKIGNLIFKSERYKEGDTYRSKIFMYKAGKKQTLTKNAEGAFVTNGKIIYYVLVGREINAEEYTYENTIYCHNIKTGKRKKIISGTNYTVLGCTGKYLYYGTNNGAEGIDLYSLSLKSGKKKYMIDGAGSVTVSGKRVVVNPNSGDAGTIKSIYSFRVDGSDKRKIAEANGLHYVKGNNVYYIRIRTKDWRYKLFVCTLTGKKKKALTGWMKKIPEKYDSTTTKSKSSTKSKPSTKSELVKNVKKRVSGPVRKVYYTDFDYDGNGEAFVIMGSYGSETLWFSSKKQTKQLKEAGEILVAAKDQGICKVSARQKIFIAEGTNGGPSSWSYCLYVKKGKVYEVKKVMGGLGQISGKYFKFVSEAYDNYLGSDGISTGHTYKKYYAKWNGKKFIQYKGKKISQSALKKYIGAAGYIEQIQKLGCSIGTIFLRNTGRGKIININVFQKSSDGTSYGNVNLKIKGKKVVPIVIYKKGKNIIERTGYGGIYTALG